MMNGVDVGICVYPFMTLKKWGNQIATRAHSPLQKNYIIAKR